MAVEQTNAAVQESDQPAPAQRGERTTGNAGDTVAEAEQRLEQARRVAQQDREGANQPPAGDDRAQPGGQARPDGGETAGGDPVARAEQRFEAVTADGVVGSEERARLVDTLNGMSAAERQDFYRAVAEPQGDERGRLNPPVPDTGERDGAAQQKFFYEVLQGPYAGGLRSEYIDYLADNASDQARADFVQGVASEARFSGTANHVARVIAGIEESPYALREAYDALIRQDLADQQSHNAVLANVMRAAAEPGNPDIESDRTPASDAYQPPVLGDILENFRTILGDERQDVFRRAGAFEAASRVLNAQSTAEGAQASDAVVESALSEMAGMVARDGARLIDELQASYGQNFDGGLQAFFETALKTGTSDALTYAGATLGILRAPTERFVAEVQRIHDERAAIDQRAAADAGAATAAQQLTEAQYAYYPEERAPQGYEWNNEVFRSFDASSALFAYSQANESLSRAVQNLNDSVDGVASDANRAIGVANFSVQFLTGKYPLVSAGVDVGSAALQETIKFAADRRQDRNESRAADLAGTLDVPRNLGAAAEGQQPPALAPRAQTDVELHELISGKARDADNPVPFDAYMLLSDLKDGVTRNSEADDQVQRAQSAPDRDGEMSTAQREQLLEQFRGLDSEARRDAFREVISEHVSGSGGDPETVRAMFEAAVSTGTRDQFVEVVNQAAPQAQRGFVEALAPRTTANDSAASAVGDVLAAMEPVGHRGGSRTSQPPMAEALAALLDSSTDHARLRAVLEASAVQTGPATPRAVYTGGEPTTKLDDIVESVHASLGTEAMRSKNIVFDQAASILNDQAGRLGDEAVSDAMTALAGMLVEGGTAFMLERQSGNYTGDGLTDLFELAFRNVGSDSELGRESGAVLGTTLQAFRAPLDEFVSQLAEASQAGDRQAVEALARSISPDTTGGAMASGVDPASPLVPRQLEHLRIIREAMVDASDRIEQATGDRTSTMQNLAQTGLTVLSVRFSHHLLAAGSAQATGVVTESLRRAGDDMAERRAEGTGLAPGEPSDYDTAEEYLDAASRPQAVLGDGSGEPRVAGRDLHFAGDDVAEGALRELLEGLDI